MVVEIDCNFLLSNLSDNIWRSLGMIISIETSWLFLTLENMSLSSHFGKKLSGTASSCESQSVSLE